MKKHFPWMVLTGAVLVAGVAPAQDAGPAPPLFHHPHLTLGGGKLSYREHHFDLAPDLKSSFREPFLEIGWGWDFIFEGQHALAVDFSFLGTKDGTERWKEAGTLVQEDRLDIGRFSFGLGYVGSSWNRALPPEELSGPARFWRFAGGAGLYYRHQAFRRDEFVDFTTAPPTFSDVEVKETFDMVGPEAMVELEFGPRHILAGFVRGRVGGGYVGVLNDGLEPLVDKEDARIDTASVHGTVEVGVLSQLARHVELRLGYRYHRQEVFEDKRTISAVDPVAGPVLITIELPDNTTEIHMGFIEAAFPF